MTVSIIMANYCGAPYLPAAIDSVLRQTYDDIELLVSDDASTDASADIVRDFATRDPRVRLIEAPSNSGPAAARNRALKVATGDWIAVMDSDDLIHPDRIRRMVKAAERLGADMVADDKLFFGETAEAGGRTLLGPLCLRAPIETNIENFLDSGRPGTGQPPFGYLKPLMRRATIGELRYDEGLKNSEDYDFYLRMLLKGARFFLLPDPMYLYRRHSASISFRLTVPNLRSMIESQDKMRPTISDPHLRAILDARRAELYELLSFQILVDAIKARDLPTALRQIARHPAFLMRLATIALARLKRRPTSDQDRSPMTLSMISQPHQAISPSTTPFQVIHPPTPGDSWPEARLPLPSACRNSPPGMISM